MRPLFAAAAIAALIAGAGAAQTPSPGARADLARLRVSEDGRSLVREDGAPFFWLGDTAWSLFEKAVREPAADQPEVDLYFRTRAAQGFTVVQTTLIKEEWEDAYGHALFEDDQATPRVRPGPADDYWDMASYIVDRAAAHGMYLAILPAWAANIPADHPLVQSPAAAYRYGHFLGTRYGDRRHLIWVLGGDPHRRGTDVDHPERLAMIRALAEGIADGVNGADGQDGSADWATTLMSYHPKGGNHSSSERLHDEPWLDFNMIQTTTARDFANYVTVERDYARTPPKPTFDSEVAYEASHSLGGTTRESPLPRISPWEVRRAAYWNVFAGGFGHTYGHRSFIRWTRTGERLVFGADVPWHQALEAPGARQMRHLKELMLSRPSASVPDQSLLIGDAGSRRTHARAARAADGSFAFVYLPSGGDVTIDLTRLSGATVRARWFDPRDGSLRAAGESSRAGARTFQAPSRGDAQDWVLVLDDAGRGLRVPPVLVKRHK
jgi:hypothetical protein